LVAESNRIALIGIGNVLMQDEGVAIEVIESLQQEYRFNPAITIVDGGTTGMDLLPYFEEHDKILIVDAVEFGKEPGFIGSIENDDILRTLNDKLSLHHLGLSDVLMTMRIHDITPEHIFLLGIQPQSLAVEIGLTETIASRLPRLKEVVLFQLEKWGVRAEPMSTTETSDS
jgi:hydrogenase maturation protease